MVWFVITLAVLVIVYGAYSDRDRAARKARRSAPLPPDPVQLGLQINPGAGRPDKMSG